MPKYFSEQFLYFYLQFKSRNTIIMRWEAELETWHAATYLRAYVQRNIVPTPGESLCYCPKGKDRLRKDRKKTGWKDRKERVQSVTFADSSYSKDKETRLRITPRWRLMGGNKKGHGVVTTPHQHRGIPLRRRRVTPTT